MPSGRRLLLGVWAQAGTHGGDVGLWGKHVLNRGPGCGARADARKRNTFPSIARVLEQDRRRIVDDDFFQLGLMMRSETTPGTPKNIAKWSSMLRQHNRYFCPPPRFPKCVANPCPPKGWATKSERRNDAQGSSSCHVRCSTIACVHSSRLWFSRSGVAHLCTAPNKCDEQSGFVHNISFIVAFPRGCISKRFPTK